jgi:glycine oxidase
MEVVIVGHGLAGAILSHTLMKRGISACVLEANKAHAASKVSAGLINPLIGPKLNIPHDFTECMEENLRFFPEIEKVCGESFLDPIDLLRVFTSFAQLEKWGSISSPYQLDLLDEAKCRELGVDCPFGLGKTSAWILNSEKFITYSRSVLTSKGSYIEKVFEPEEWVNHPVIFCEGFRVTQNRWFQFLPFAPAQGDVLTVQSSLRHHLSNGNWHLFDLKSATARIGSSWKYENLEEGPDENAKLEIIKKLCFVPNIHHQKILEHNSGVRSGTRDRQPIIGRHPDYPNYYIFNGFGSRGCTTLVKSAREFVRFFLEDIPLPESKNLMRFVNS